MVTANPHPNSSVIRQYWSLTKPRVVALIVFTAVIGMFLAVPGLPPLRESVLGTLGIWLAAASAAAINQILDARIDANMARTSWRPLVAGTLTVRQALVFALVLAAASMLVLMLGVNQVTAWLTFASLIGYAVVYTKFLKRATPQNIVIGGIAGAAPPLLGWAAVTNMQGPWDWAHALLLAESQKLVFVHPYDDEAIVAGQGTVGLEMLQAVPELEVLVVAVGGGGLIAGMATAAKALKPGIEIIGVQTARFPGMVNAIKGTHHPQGTSTIADGIAVGTPGVITQAIIARRVDDLLLVDEGDIEQAMVMLLEI